MPDSAATPSALPADDPNRKLTVANPDSPSMEHISVAGDTYTVLLTGEETGGRYSLIDMHVTPGGGPPPHRHDFEEMFTVLDGEIELTFRGEGNRRLDRERPRQRAPLFQERVGAAGTAALHVHATRSRGVLQGVGDPVDSRTAPPPKLSEEEQAERGKRAKALAPKYRSELLVP